MNPFDFHPDAQNDLDSIWEFIARDSIDAADQFIDKILRTIQTAAGVPFEGHRRPDLTSRPLRFLHLHEYLIAYAPDETPLLVIAVIHGRRSPRLIAALLRSRQ